MKERYVLEALLKAVNNSTTLPKKFPGRNFKIPDDGKYLEVVSISNNFENEFWSEGKTYQGILRLILHFPMKDTGVYAMYDTLKDISQHFPKGARFSDPLNTVYVKITDNPNCMSLMEIPPEIIIPLTIRYNCFTT